MDHQTTQSISRRGLLGLGAATGLVAVVGMPSTASAAPRGIGPSPDEYSNAVTVNLTPGSHVRSKNALSFGAFSTGVGSSLAFVSNLGGVWNGVGDSNFVAVTLDLPTGAVLNKVDVLGNRSAAGSQAWSIQAVNIITGVEDAAVSVTAVAAAAGPTQGTATMNKVVGAGDTVIVRLDATSGTNRAVGVVYQYTAPGASFVAIAPRRVYDSRRDTAGKIVRGVTRTINVSNEFLTSNTVVPAGASAIAYNITVTETEGNFGYLSVAPGGVSPSPVSSINWSAANSSIANGLVVGVNSSREISVLCEPFANSKTHFIIDVLGYYV